MPNKQDLYLIVKADIDDWDPVNLLPHAPEDEYDSESASIDNKLLNDMSALEIAEIISAIFIKSFDDKFTVEECIKPATRILNLIS